MTRAETCIPRILAHEGGFVDNPNDNGGPTNRGITIATFRRYIKPGGTVADLKRLTEAQAVVVYKRQYWDKVSADLLPRGVDYAIADFAVNSGPSRAAKYLQGILGVTQDGRIGPQTIEAARATDPAQLAADLCDARLAFLKRLSDWEHFGNGWTRRVEQVRRDAIADAQPASKSAEIVGAGAAVAGVAALDGVAQLIAAAVVIIAAGVWIYRNR